MSSAGRDGTRAVMDGAAVRRAQRAAARLHHPDRGGSADDLVAAFAAIGRPAPGGTASAGDDVRVVRVVRTVRTVRTVRGRRASWRRSVRALMPRRRRYIEIERRPARTAAGQTSTTWR